MSAGYGEGPVPPGASVPGALAPQVPGTPGPYLLASYGQRAGAAVIDFLVKAVFAVMILIGIGSAFGIGFLAGDETSGIVAVVVALILGFAAFAAASLLYEPAYMAATDGRTLGKQITGCRVVRTSGERMTFGWAVLREVVIKWLGFNVVGNSITAGLPVAMAADNLWPLWDDENRALHDFAAGTRVVKA